MKRTKRLRRAGPALVLLLAVGGIVWVRWAQVRAERSRQLLDAIIAHRTQEALALLTAGADPNVREGNASPSLWNLLPILFRREMRSETSRATALMLAASAFPLKEPTAPCPLHHNYGNAEVVKALLKRGADVNAQGSHGQTALCFSLQERSNAVFLLLLAHGAKVNLPGSIVAPLMEAACINDVEAIRALLAHGADVKAHDNRGNSALMWGILTDASVPLLEELRRHGANLTEQNHFGLTPLKMAQNEHSSATIRWLQAHGVTN